MYTKIRNFRPADLEGYVALYNASESADPDFKRKTVEGVRRNTLERPHYDPEGHFVAIEEGRIIVAGGSSTIPSM